MNLPRDILVVPWERDFISTLADLLVERHQDSRDGLRQALVIFPHRRPARFLARSLRRHEALAGRPVLLPEMLAVGELFERLAPELTGETPRLATSLDQAALLMDIVRELRAGEDSPLAALPDDARLLFPWCLRLAALLEEFFRAAARPGSLPHLEGQVEPFAAALLGRLSQVHDRYVDELSRRELSTPGLEARRVAELALQAPEVSSLEGRTVWLCGFYALTGAEDALFRALWSAGRANVLWHADESLAAGSGQPHWSQRELVRWLERWGARAQALGAGEAVRTPKTIRFYEGFDLHSQLHVMRRELCGDPDLADTAVVIPDTGMLVPVLHHLPERDVNVSMGYPLARTPLFELVETLLALQESAPTPGRYLWKDVVTLLRHPYLKMLAAGEGQPLRPVLRAFEAQVRAGGKLVDPRALALEEEVLAGLTTEEREAAPGLVDELFAVCLDGFSGLTSLGGLADALERLGRFLRRRGGELWRTFLIDAECLHRLMHSVIPALRGSLLSGIELGPGALFAVLRELVRAERVPFEAEPLTGLQVMGLLEARLLGFRRLLIMDATDDRIPGAPAYDPLLPDPLRHALGLPDTRERDYVAAYNFHRLLAASRETHLFYQSGVRPGSILDSKSLRSRFVEELLWKEEQALGRIVKPGDGVIELIDAPVRGLAPGDGGVDKTPLIMERLETLFARPLSPTKLDTYMRCPARFFLQYLTPLSALDEVTEDGDAGKLGVLAHEVLKDFLMPFEGRDVVPARLPREALRRALEARLAEPENSAALSYDARLLIGRTLPYRTEKYLDTQDFPTKPVALEREARASVEVDGRHVALEGRLDRVDDRDDTRLVLDYKTGVPPSPARGVFADQDLVERLEAWRPAGVDIGNGAGTELLVELATRLKSVQLPLYLHLHNLTAPLPADNAAWVDLRDSGQEIPLLDTQLDPAERIALVERFVPAVVAFLIRHMRGASRFEALPGRQCAHCDYASACEAAQI